MEFKWPVAVFHPKEPAITMTLSYFQTEKPQPIATARQLEPVPKKIINKRRPATPAPQPTLNPKPDFILPPTPKADPIASNLSKSAPQPEKIEIRAEPEPVRVPQETLEKSAGRALEKKQALQTRAPAAPMIHKAKPLFRRNPPPRYPRLARKRKYQGVVILEVFVNQEGSVGDIKVFKSSGYAILDKTAMKTVKKWEFEPGKRGDENVGMWVRTPVRFQLE